jgi:hypothetical protein
MALAAWCYAWRKINGWITDRTREIAVTERLTRQAAELGGMTPSLSLSMQPGARVRDRGLDTDLLAKCVAIRPWSKDTCRMGSPRLGVDTSASTLENNPCPSKCRRPTVDALEERSNI